MFDLKSQLALGLFRLTGRLSLAQTRRIGHFLGNTAYRLNTRMAQVTRTNLALCLPHLDSEALEQMVRRSLQETGKTATEICVLWGSRRPPLQELIGQRHGEDLLHAELARGKGVLLLGPHLGNWEVMGIYLPTLGPITSLYQPPKKPIFESIMRQNRESSGGVLVPTNTKGIAAVLRALKAGQMSGILPDQNPHGDNSGAYAPFFGQPAFTMTLLYKLIQRTGCRVMFAYAKRTETGFDVVFRAAPEGIYKDDQTIALTALNKGVEDLVMEAPEQYQWEYKRFKKVPEGRARVYN